MSHPNESDKPDINSGMLKNTSATHSSQRRILVFLTALIGIGTSLWLASSLPRGLSPQPRTTAQQEDLYPSAKVNRKGSLNGMPMAIREDYLEFPVSYTDKSPWESASSPDYYQKKGYADAISSFSVVLHWPSMEPHKPSNHTGWLTYRTFKPTDWFSIGIAGDLKPEARPPYTPYNRLARNIRNSMKRVIESPYKRIESDGKEVRADLRYELHGLDRNLGLQVARTVGRDAARPGGGNNTFYWRGDLQHIVETSIRCPAGILPNPSSVHTCVHEFEMLELGAYVTVYYTENLLPQWQQIEAHAREFILSLRVDSKNPSIR